MNTCSSIELTLVKILNYTCKNGFQNIEGETERELTFEIGAGKEECFYETAEKGNIIDIEYQVNHLVRL